MGAIFNYILYKYTYIIIYRCVIPTYYRVYEEGARNVRNKLIRHFTTVDLYFDQYDRIL